MGENEGDAMETANEVREFIAAWITGASEVLSQLCGATVAIEGSETKPAAAPEPSASDLRFLVAAGGSLRGEMELRLPQSTALTLSQVLLGEAQDPAAEFKAEHAEAAEELLRQVSGHVVTALKAEWGEVQLRVERAEAPTWSPAATGWLHSSPGAAPAIVMEWNASAALVAALRPLQVTPGQPVSPAPAGDRLDLLMDVELGMTLRFGSRSMLLREILDLNSGSVLPLDRQVDDPADLLLDGRLIARGEVVVVEGNYGFRVTEVMSSQPEH
ncbi:MAG TPA: flagellar motor switch protein FliN [Terriglobales bacterium]|nr:flagellar motor switch protein FliN [Terriglobales bacterium]